VEILPKALSKTTTTEGSRDPVIITDEPSEIDVSDDDAMSIGDSGNEGGISENYSGTGSSSCGESTASRGSRKRPADESPEREPKEISRREFPGNVTRSQGGCRIYVPTVTSVNATPADQLNATPADQLNATPADQSNATAAEIPSATNEGISNATVTERVAAKAAESRGAIISVRVTAITTESPTVTNAEILVAKEPTVSNATAATSNATAATSNATVATSNATERPSLAETTVATHPTVITIDLNDLIPVTSQAVPLTDVTVPTSDVSRDVVAPTVVVTARAPLATEAWARDALMVEAIFQIMEGMEPPWITLNILDAAALRFPAVDRETLRLTIMTMMMTQRRCIVRLTRAGVRLGPRTDRDGNSFVELDLDYAERYSTSH